MLGTISIMIKENKNMTVNNNRTTIENINTAEHNNETTKYMEPQHQNNTFIETRAMFTCVSRGATSNRAALYYNYSQDKTSHALDSYLY